MGISEFKHVIVSTEKLRNQVDSFKASEQDGGHKIQGIRIDKPTLLFPVQFDSSTSCYY